MLRRNKDLWALLSLFALCLLTRLYSIPASLWEWDDINFARALHDFNIPDHSPHPPGFPVFIAMGRAANVFLNNDHRALVAVNLIFAILLGPLLYLLFREILEDRVIAFCAALLSCFAPVLWVHSTIARSDGPTLGLGVIAMLLIFKGRRSSRALIAGCAVLGIAMGVRVSVIPFVGPVLILVIIQRIRAREFKLIGACALALIAAVVIWYVPMIVHTTWSAYQRAMKTQSDYVWSNDPIWVPWITLEKRFTSFFLRIWGALWIAHVIYVLALIGSVCLFFWKRRALSLMVLAFVPYIVFTFIFNTPMGAIVYSMPYIPFFAGLAACGLLLPSELATKAKRNLQYGGIAFLLLLTMLFAGWSLPLIKILRGESSPPVRACEYLKGHSSNDDVVVFQKLFTPHVSYYLPDRQTQQIPDLSTELNAPGNLVNPSSGFDHTYLLSTEAPHYPGISSQHFDWPPGPMTRRLHTLSIGRYFDAWVTDVTNAQNVRFLASPDLMVRNRRVGLYATSDRMVLHLKAQAETSGDVVLRMSGREIGHLFVDQTLDKSFDVLPDQQRVWEILTIEGGPLKIQEFSWEPGPASTRIHRKDDEFLGEGWFYRESQKPSGGWRWTGATARVHLPPIEGDARVEISVMAPENNWPLELKIAGQTLRRRTIGTAESVLTYEVPVSLHKESATDLVLLTQTKQIPGDSRPLGVRVKYLRWIPATH